MGAQLVHLPEIQRLSNRVIRILGGNPGKFTLQGTNTYIVGTGAQRILIDTAEGRPSWIKAVREVLNEEKAECLAIITHWHIDHVGGIGHLLEHYPNTIIYKHQPGPNQQDIRDGQVFNVDGATLRAVHTPGHTLDHMALILEEEDAMFTGDNVLGQGTAVFEDLQTYTSSLEKMKDMFSGRAYPGHGPVIDNGSAKIVEYIQHRQQREQQDNQLTSWNAMEIVKIIYKDYPESLHIPAHGGVMQVLQKLQHEDKVSLDSSTNTWRVNSKATL